MSGCLREKNYLVPFYVAKTLLFYNKTMFKRRGCRAAQMFDELLTSSQAMGKGEKTGFLTLNFDWLYWPLMKMNGIDLLTPDLKKPAFNTPAAAELLDRLAKATASGAINKIAWTGRWVEPNGAFASGTVGMLQAHSSAYFFVKGQGRWINPDTLGATQAPGDWSTPTNHGFGVSKSSKNWSWPLPRQASDQRQMDDQVCADPPGAYGQYRGRQGRAGFGEDGGSAGLRRDADAARTHRQDDRQLAAGQ